MCGRDPPASDGSYLLSDLEPHASSLCPRLSSRRNLRHMPRSLSSL